MTKCATTKLPAGQSAPEPANQIDGGTYRSIMGRYPTGVVIVTGVDESGQPQGMVVGTFSSVSLEPPLVAFMPSVTSSSWAKMQDITRLCINVLAADQEELCRVFASKGATDKWEGVNWRPSPAGAPILEGSIAWIECEVEEVLTRGDHHIVIGQVQALEAMRSVSPLTFIRGGYGRFTTDSLVSEEVPGLMEQLRVSQMARATMEQLAHDTGCSASAQAVHGDELVILAAAGGDDPDWAGTRHIGIRLPFIPPFGGLFMAWSSEDAVEEWLGRRWASDEPFRERIRAEMRAIREAGYVVVTPIEPEIDQTLDLMFSGGKPTKEALARMRQKIEEIEPYALTTLEPDTPYLIRYLGAPIFDEQGRVLLALRLVVGDVLDAAATAALVDRLVAAAAEVTEQIGGRPPSAVALDPEMS